MNKENKYQIKCINYFADRDFIVYGNLCTPKRYIPITFVTDENNFKCTKLILSNTLFR